MADGLARISQAMGSAYHLKLLRYMVQLIESVIQGVPLSSWRLRPRLAQSLGHLLLNVVFPTNT